MVKTSFKIWYKEIGTIPGTQQGELWMLRAVVGQFQDISHYAQLQGDWAVHHWLLHWAIELQTKVIRRYTKILQSQRRPLLGPVPYDL